MPNQVSFPRISALSVALAGVLTQQACAAPGQPAAGSPAPATSIEAAPAASGGPSPAVSAGLGTSAASSAPASGLIASPASASSSAPRAAGAFSGQRQVYLLPLHSEAIFAVGKSGKVELSDTFDDRALFVLTAVGGGEYWIRTAKLRSGGEALCLGVKGKTVLTMACDAAAQNQLFRFHKTGTAEGKPKYTIRTGADTYLVQDPRGELAPNGTGVVATRIGEGTRDIDTPFFLPDRGKADMPVLD